MGAGSSLWPQLVPAALRTLSPFRVPASQPGGHFKEGLSIGQSHTVAPIPVLSTARRASCFLSTWESSSPVKRGGEWIDWGPGDLSLEEGDFGE